MEIMAYFNSGNKARFDLDKTIFKAAKDIDAAYIQHALDMGQTVVITDNVSFIREYDPPKEDLD